MTTRLPDPPIPFYFFARGVWTYLSDALASGLARDNPQFSYVEPDEAKATGSIVHHEGRDLFCRQHSLLMPVFHQASEHHVWSDLLKRLGILRDEVQTYVTVAEYGEMELPVGVDAVNLWSPDSPLRARVVMAYVGSEERENSLGRRLTAAERTEIDTGWVYRVDVMVAGRRRVCGETCQLVQGPYNVGTAIYERVACNQYEVGHVGHHRFIQGPIDDPIVSVTWA